MTSLSLDQLQKAKEALSGESQSSVSLAAIEASVGEERRCPHCHTMGAISCGKARGLRRYQCKGCGKTFNAATVTPLSGLHCKEKMAQICKNIVGYNSKLKGIVETDEPSS